VVGVPEIKPVLEFIVSPAGESLCSRTMYTMFFPPVADRARLYGSPDCTRGRDSGRTARSVLIVMLRACVAV